jgi:hypothetical protein
MCFLARNRSSIEVSFVMAMKVLAKNQRVQNSAKYKNTNFSTKQYSATNIEEYRGTK